MFGKLRICDKESKKKYIIRDTMILPKWAKSHHHFIAMNYLALEHPKVRMELCRWINLIFGYEQQSREQWNLFNPLTSYVGNL